MTVWFLPMCHFPINVTTVLAVLNQGLGSDHFSTDTIWLHWRESFPCHLKARWILLHRSTRLKERLHGRNISLLQFRWLVTTQSTALSDSQDQAPYHDDSSWRWPAAHSAQNLSWIISPSPNSFILPTQKVTLNHLSNFIPIFVIWFQWPR